MARGDTTLPIDETLPILPEEEIYEVDIYGVGDTTEAMGGVNGEANIPVRGLVNRTAWLKKMFSDIITWKNSIDLSLYSLNTHTHAYLPTNGKAVDSDKLDGIDSYKFKSYAEFIHFNNVSFPALAEESFATITSLKRMRGRSFDVLDNGVIKFKQSGIYKIKVKIISDSAIIGADPTRVKISAWQKAAHFHPTNDHWDEVLTEITCYLWEGYELRLEYDSGRLHTWNDPRFSYVNITRIGEAQ